MTTRRIALFFLLTAAVFAQTKSLHLFSSNGVKAPLDQILPHSEHAIGATVSADFGTGTTLGQRIQAGETFDVALLATDVIDRLIMDGKLIAATRKDIARVGIGVAVRAGTPKPDVHNAEALKQTLLAAKSISFNRNGASVPAINAVFAKLGIADQMKAKLMLETVSGQPQENVVRGKADIVMTLMPEMLWEGLEIAGPLPDDLQSYITFAAAVSTNTKNPEAAKALVGYITAPGNAGIYKSTGVEPAK